MLRYNIILMIIVGILFFFNLLKFQGQPDGSICDKEDKKFFDLFKEKL